MTFKVFVTSEFCRSRTELSPSLFEVESYGSERMARPEFLQSASHADALVVTLCERIDDELLFRCPALKMVANTAVGFDNIDVPACTSRGVLVSNTPGVLDDATADLTMGLILSVARRLGEAERYLRSGKWDGFKLNLLLGSDLKGKTIGLVGCGRIGRRVAARAKCFSLKTIYHCRTRLSTNDEKKLALEYVCLNELLERSDFVSLHCPLNDETRRFMGAEQFERMKNSAYLINTSRGGVVDEPSLIDALERGTIAGAGLDVYVNEPEVPEALLKLENVVLLPHVGSATEETRAAMAGLAVEAVNKSFAGQKPSNLVNPEVWERFLEYLQ